jgi:DNA-binding IclR family transcriptional regulator
VESVRTRTSGPSAVELGARLPAHATAAGKVIMAYAGPLPDRLAESQVALTARTITEMPVLVAQLAGIRRDGVAVERGELEVGRSGAARRRPQRSSAQPRRSMMVTLAWPPPSHMVCSP